MGAKSYPNIDKYLREYLGFPLAVTRYINIGERFEIEFEYDTRGCCGKDFFTTKTSLSIEEAIRLGFIPEANVE